MQQGISRIGRLDREHVQTRTGQPMGEDNIWLAGRHQERDALGRIILTLGDTRLAGRAVRGAGVDACTSAITDKPDTN